MDVPHIRMHPEAGMGETLWCDNDAARDQWTSYVDPDDLPISDELRSALVELARLTSIGWELLVPGQEDMPAPDPLTDQWRRPTLAEIDDARRLRALVVARLPDELGDDYRITFDDPWPPFQTD